MTHFKIIALVFTLSACSFSSSKTNKNDISSIDVYCWCFNLNYFKYNKFSTEDTLVTLRDFQLCMTPINMAPSIITVDEKHKETVINKERIKMFEERILNKVAQQQKQKAVDARLVFVVNYSKSAKKDTLVYINSNAMWVNGYYEQYNNDIDSLLSEFCGKSIKVCSSD